MTAHRRHGNSHTKTIVREVKVCLEQHAAKTASIEQLAARYQLTGGHLCRVFKKYTGVSPYQYYLKFRIYRAKEMLRDTTLSMKEIAVSLQFETSFHFSTIFRKKTGMSPTQWRRRVLDDRYLTTETSGQHSPHDECIKDANKVMT